RQLRAPFLRRRLPLWHPPVRARALPPHRGASLRQLLPPLARPGGARDRPRIPRPRLLAARSLPRRAPRGGRPAAARDDGALRERLSADLRSEPATDRVPPRDRLAG